MKYNVKLCHADGAVIRKGNVKAESVSDAVRRFVDKKFPGMTVEQFCPTEEVVDGNTSKWWMEDVDADGADGYFEVIPA